jgi:trans-L-3-hydroxyproline dehydratase
MPTLKTIDAHAGGGPLRLVVDGFPAPRGRTMLDKIEWVRRHADGLRRMLMLEPRGHAGMAGAILTDSAAPGSHAGLIFMTGEGYAPMSGHGIVAVTTIALERGLLMPGGDGQAIVFDTAAGAVRAHAHGDSSRIASVTVTNVPSFVVEGGVAVNVSGRDIRVDIAFGGAFYAIVDSESLGLGVDAALLPELRRAAAEVKRAVDAAHPVGHPLEPRLKGVSGTVFTAPPRAPGADLRNVTVSGGGHVDRSPGGTGTAAVLAVLDAMGLVAPGQPFVHEGLIGTCMSGRVAGRTRVGDYDAIIAELEGSAWITGAHTFVARDDDPLGDGFQM